VWGKGWMATMGALDYAGGTVVHINAGVAGLVLSLVLGKRIGYGKEAMFPSSIALTALGAALLWFGWFGFNAGSALAADGQAGSAFLVTNTSAAAGALAWMFTEWGVTKKPTVLGIASGVVAGLVAITPAAGNVGIVGALVIGTVAGFACLWGVNGLKRLLGADDSLDVFGVHGVGGIVGALLTGVFSAGSLGGVKGDDFSIASQLLIQAEGVVITMVWSSVVAFIAYKIVDMTMGLRVSEEQEREGLDISSHGETAYNR